MTHTPWGGFGSFCIEQSADGDVGGQREIFMRNEKFMINVNFTELLRHSGLIFQWKCLIFVTNTSLQRESQHLLFLAKSCWVQNQGSLCTEGWIACLALRLWCAIPGKKKKPNLKSSRRNEKVQVWSTKNNTIGFGFIVQVPLRHKESPSHFP